MKAHKILYMGTMAVSRRSFLGLVAAALGVKPGRLLCKAGIPIEQEAQMVEALLPFTLWETVTLNPGQAGRVEIFPGPFPSAFLIQRISQAVNAPTLYRDARAVYDAVDFMMTAHEKTLLRAPLAFIGMSPSSAQLMPAYALAASDNPSTSLLISGSLNISAPVSVHITLGGAVKRWVPSALFEESQDNETLI